MRSQVYRRFHHVMNFSMWIVWSCFHFSASRMSDHLDDCLQTDWKSQNLPPYYWVDRVVTCGRACGFLYRPVHICTAVLTAASAGVWTVISSETKIQKHRLVRCHFDTLNWCVKRMHAVWVWHYWRTRLAKLYECACWLQIDVSNYT